MATSESPRNGKDRELQRILHTELIGLPSTLRIHLFINHWPSDHLNDSAAAARSRLAQDLRNRLRSMPTTPHVMMLGDFNVEPFDAAISEELEASRSRDAVRKGRALLYNPFWRLLGERQSLQEALLLPRRGAGTYLYRSSNATSQWYTMDQILVSAPLLGSRALASLGGGDIYLAGAAASRGEDRPPPL